MTEPAVGDVVICTEAAASFEGLRCTVIGVKGEELHLKPNTSRPDGCGLAPFYWPIDEVTSSKVDEVTSPKVDSDLTRFESLLQDFGLEYDKDELWGEYRVVVKNTRCQQAWYFTSDGAIGEVS